MQDFINHRINKFEFQNAFKNMVCDYFQTKIWVGDENDQIMLLNIEKYRLQIRDSMCDDQKKFFEVMDRALKEYEEFCKTKPKGEVRSLS